MGGGGSIMIGSSSSSSPPPSGLTISSLQAKARAPNNIAKTDRYFSFFISLEILVAHRSWQGIEDNRGLCRQLLELQGIGILRSIGCYMPWTTGVGRLLLEGSVLTVPTAGAAKPSLLERMEYPRE